MTIQLIKHHTDLHDPAVKIHGTRPSGSEAVDNSPGGVRPLHPEPGTGCNRRADGVQRLHPNPTGNRPGNPPPPRPRAGVRPQPVLAAAVGRPVSSSAP
jgi:hypothetical protein